MNSPLLPRFTLLLLLAASALNPLAANANTNLSLIGTIKPRSATEITSSPWSIGGETLDRDFTVYAHYKKYLKPLGAKSIRLQAGWAKCEKTPGVFQWHWLDQIVDDALAQGLQPWLETSYGNTIYPGGGGTGLGGGLPQSPEALAAWDNWVRALVRRYKGRVHAWEVWNEPDLGKATGPQDYARLFIRTAQLIRSEQPRARIYALALAGNLKFAEEFLSHVVHQRKLELIDALTIHGYPRDPDETTNIDRLRAIIARFGRPIEVRQGETGAPSKYQENFALSKLPWSELTQAKWNLRRMLAHRGKDVPFNLFTISDMHYRQKGKLQMNYKGLLETNPDQTIARPKQAYFAAQHVFTIFDDQLVRCTNFWCQPDVAKPIAAYAYSNTNFNASLVSLWFNDRPPAETNAMVFVNLTFQGVKFREPVYADLLTGCVYALPLQGEGFSFKDLPLYDSPILIAEKRALPLNPLPGAHAQPPSAATGSPVICGRLHP